MKGKVHIDKITVENGRGERIVPIFYAIVHVPSKVFENDRIRARAYEAVEETRCHSRESSVFNVLGDTKKPMSGPKIYSNYAIYVATPEANHTKNIVEDLIREFSLDSVVELRQ